MVEFVDIYPTLCQLSGIPIPKGVDGRSLVPLLENPDEKWPYAAFSQYPRPRSRHGSLMGYSMRVPRYRLTLWKKWSKDEIPGKTVGIELYDYEKDPRGTVNVANEPEYKKTLEELKERFNKTWGDICPENYKREMASEQ
jgi:arylsulfatase A-like enzyme